MAGLQSVCNLSAPSQLDPTHAGGPTIYNHQPELHATPPPLTPAGGATARTPLSISAHLIRSSCLFSLSHTRRWHNHLNPDIKRGAWSRQEDEIIVRFHRRHGNQASCMLLFV